jgi:hypothetical protein
MRPIGTTVIAAAALCAALPAGAQTTQARAADARSARKVADERYQIAQMERVLEGAVEHGVTVTRDRLQAVAQMPADMLVSDNAHARGFRLEGYGAFFDVIVPSFETTLTWSLRTLDQNDLGLDSALRVLQRHVESVGDANLEQALKRVELQMSPSVTRGPAVETAARTRTGSAAAVTAPSGQQAPDDPILADPNEAYRQEVISALKDAMLSHSSSLAIGANDWLTIAAKGNDDRPRLAPADSDARTLIIRLRGSDLADFLAGRLSREDALQRIEVRAY